MDGLGAAASVIAVLQLAASVASYINTAVGATEDRRRLRDGLRSCEFVLRQLADNADDSEEGKAWKQTIQALEAPGAPLGRLWVALRAVEMLIAPPKDGPRKFLAQLKWPFATKEVDKLLLTLERERALLGLALNNNSRKLLQALTATSYENKRLVTELLEAVGKNTLLQENNLTLTRRLADEIAETRKAIGSFEQRSQRVEDLAKLDAALNRLSPLDFYTTQMELFNRKRKSGTSTWILRHQAFKAWFNRSRSGSKDPDTQLGLTGDPGSGKSVLCSVMVDRVQKSLSVRSALVYIYGRKQERGSQSPENIVGSLIKQLGLQCPDIASRIVSAYERRKAGSPRHIKDLIKLLNGYCSVSLLYLFIDGLDEMSPDTLTVLGTFLKAFRDKEMFYLGFQIVLSGRRYALQTFPWPAVWPEKEIEAEAMIGDIKVVIKAQVARSANMRIVADGYSAWQGRIISGIIHGVLAQSAPFAMARVYVDRVAEEVTKVDMIQAVAGLRQTLPEHLDETLNRIRQSAPACARIAFMAMAWVLHARTVLHKDQLCEALAINMSDTRLVKNRIPSIKLVLEACQGLILVNADSGVEFFHHTVMEHLATQPELEDLAMSTVEEIDTRRGRYPLAFYLSVHWSDYVRGETEQELEQHIIELLASLAVLSSLQLLPREMAVESLLVGHFCAPEPDTWWDCENVPLYLAVSFGLKGVVHRLIAVNHDLEFVVPQGQTYSSLHVAVHQADLDMAEVLVKAGANLNLQDRWGLTPLRLAMTLSDVPTRLAIVQLLCGSGASTSIRDQDGDLPLHAAVAHADIDVVKVVTDPGAEIDAKNGRGETALHYAVRRAMFRDDQGLPDTDTPQWAMASIRHLLTMGSDPSIVDKHGLSPFDAAVRSKSLGIISCVLDISSTPECHWALPESAVAAGESILHEAVLREQGDDLARGSRLLEKGQDWAAFGVRKGDGSLLGKWLEGKELDFDRRRTTLWLHEAIWARRPDMVVLLLGFGASTSERNRKGRDAKELARLLGDEEMLRVLDGGWETRSYENKTGLEWKAFFEHARRQPAASRSSSLWWKEWVRP